MLTDWIVKKLGGRINDMDKVDKFWTIFWSLLFCSVVFYFVISSGYSICLFGINFLCLG